MLEFVPETVFRISKHYSKSGQRMPTLFVKLYVFQVSSPVWPAASSCCCCLCSLLVAVQPTRNMSCLQLFLHSCQHNSTYSI